MTDDLLTTIGLEVHVELKTNTKMFCGCPVGFGGEPNTRVCQVCLGHPGTLPTMNEKAVEYTTKIAMALGCDVAPYSIFHRKNYFYPDMPKNYQISQYDHPIGEHGALEVEVDGKAHRVGITRAHLEEDTGKSLHMGGRGRIHDADYSLEDFNRAGTPLVEIVSEPDITSPEVARAYATELRAILEYLGVSDVRMEEGSMRVDANISVAPPGERGKKVEIKNMNSLRSVFRALEYEEKRQREVLRAGGTITQSTRHWDEKAGKTQELRTKEEAFDYRYFPEPDLVPIEPSVEWLRQLREELPELPVERARRYREELSLSAYDAGVLRSTKALGDLFEEALAAAKKADAKQVANWVTNDLAGLLAARPEGSSTPEVSAKHLAELVDMVAAGELSKNQGQQVLAMMLDSGRSPKKLASEAGIKQVSDESALEEAIDAALAAHPDIAERLKAGDNKPFGFLMGEIMKATKGQANPKVVSGLIRKKLQV
ncbi:MAG TPA: Asp-tRNA(Asn)/Glu-tRNA(Gln) amidotransferase subunit GatB [Actinomycetota bacterium]|nr:Asp-tRNA(Asn)/Glu-tRNA(Gln) amidotransferase subunit GatB [Actinomycetota bacterium]